MEREAARAQQSVGTHIGHIGVQDAVAILVADPAEGSQHAHLILDAQILIYFVPFVYLFCLLLRERPADRTTPSVIPGGTAGRLIAGTLGLFVTVFAMVVAAVPPSDQAPIPFEIDVISSGGWQPNLM